MPPNPLETCSTCRHLQVEPNGTLLCGAMIARGRRTIVQPSVTCPGWTEGPPADPLLHADPTPDLDLDQDDADYLDLWDAFAMHALRAFALTLGPRDAAESAYSYASAAMAERARRLRQL